MPEDCSRSSIDAQTLSHEQVGNKFIMKCIVYGYCNQCIINTMYSFVTWQLANFL